MAWPRDLQMEANAPAVGTTAANAVVVGQSRYTATVSSVQYVPAAGVTGVVTNNRTLTLLNRKTGAGTTTIASIALTSGTDLTDNVAKTIPLATGINIEVDDMLEWASDPVSGGLAEPGGLVIVQLAMRS